MLHLRDSEFLAACAEMDNTNNLNYNAMAVRCAGYKSARLAFALGVKFAEAQSKPVVESAEKLGRAYDAWYLESPHMCESVDKMKAGDCESKGEVERLTSLLNASINFNNLVRVESEVD